MKFIDIGISEEKVFELHISKMEKLTRGRKGVALQVEEATCWGTEAITEQLNIHLCVPVWALM